MPSRSQSQSVILLHTPVRRRRMTSPSPSASDLQSHLYQSFLTRKTTDVALNVSGASWHAVYHLHRVVLIQSGFFRSLFTSGFSETRHGHNDTELSIDIVFDDSNITRAAFEICISRLYGGGPPLYISPSLQPTQTHPLTPHFPNQPNVEIDVPPGHQPATPPFLLSLLATSIYLSIPSIASHALSAICGSIGPYTVIRYLEFALGRSIGSSSEDTCLWEADSAVGLEGVAEILDEAMNHDHDSLSERLSDNDSYERISSTMDSEPPAFHYGAVSDKIGEAVSAWLARWGIDMLGYEEQAAQGGAPSPLMQRKRSKTVPGPSDDIPAVTVTGKIPLIWRTGGLDAHWIKALISSDSFFVKDERQRYDVAKRVFELRGGGVGEEEVWSELFEKGIYYCNMVPDEIIALSIDVSPTTKKPYVPLHVLQAANWTHTILRHDITARPTSPSPSSPSSNKDFGTLASNPPKSSIISDQRLFPIPSDETLRIGEHGGPSSEGKGISMDELFAHSHSPFTGKPASGSDYPISFTDASYFGLSPGPSSRSSPATERHTPFPPYRFGVEFFDVDALKEKQRLHSQTIWHAGSLFNVYVQVVRKKVVGEKEGGSQLGIYVCRQSTVEAVPPVSALSPRKGDDLVAGPVAAVPTPKLSSPSTPRISSPHPSPGTRSTTPISSPRPGTSSSLPSSFSHISAPRTSSPLTLPYTLPGTPPPQPYRDSRPNVTAYFKVYCASPTGNSQTRFMSAPDQFKISQSWGWKSSSLRGEGGAIGDGVVEDKERVSLRATVVLGVV